MYGTSYNSALAEHTGLRSDHRDVVGSSDGERHRVCERIGGNGICEAGPAPVGVRQQRGGARALDTPDTRGCARRYIWRR